MFSKSASEAPSEASAAVGVERARHRHRPSLAPISMGFSLGRAGADGVLFRDVDVDADSLLEHLTHAARLVIVDNDIVHLVGPQHLKLQDDCGSGFLDISFGKVPLKERGNGSETEVTAESRRGEGARGQGGRDLERGEARRGRS